MFYVNKVSEEVFKQGHMFDRKIYTQLDEN